MNEFCKIVSGGDYAGVQLLGFLWFFIVGYVVYGLIETGNRDVYSKSTPVKWKWNFWLKDNWRRYVTTVLCSYILFRFYVEFSGHPFGEFDAVTLGLVGDGIAATLKKRISMIAGDREKLMENYKDEEKG